VLVASGMLERFITFAKKNKKKKKP